MIEQKELKNTKELLFDVYKRFRLGVITKEQAKCESELLTSIIKTIELNEFKEQIKYLNNLLTNNKKSK